MLKKFKSAFDILRRYGFFGLLLFYYRKALSKNYSKNHLFALDIADFDFSKTTIPSSHTYRFAALDDYNTVLSEPKWEIRDRDFLAFQKGDLCLLQFVDDNLVGYSWLAPELLTELTHGFHFNLPDSMIYNYKEFTISEYRGQGLQKYRHWKLCEYAKEIGKNYLLTSVNQLNLKSLRAVKKSGYKRIGTFIYSTKKPVLKFVLKISRKYWSMDRRS